ncbi:UBX10 protein, partial [Heliornis fulica]|nr:UBX10 protein [Heliornis fulica]
MATAALLTLAPSHLYFPPSSAAAFSWTISPDMYVTRPKSAKGRSRPSLDHSMDTCPSPPPPAAPQRLANSRRGSSTKPRNKDILPSQMSPVEIPELLQQVPLRTSSSLNKYKVLPSIGWKSVGSGAAAAAAERTDRLKVSEGQEDDPKIKTLSGEQGSASVFSETDIPNEEGSWPQCPPEKPGRKTSQERPLTSTLRVEESLREESQLLLAVRSPSGRRFEHHFKPTDSLQTVLAVAEQKMSSQYQCCSIETMEVPSRRFSDLTRSLHECGVLHKTVLCIRREEQHD